VPEPECEPPTDFPRSFDALYGLEVLSAAGPDGQMRGRVAIRDELRQPFGLVHGGVIASVAEALASTGTWFGVADPDSAVMGISNDTSFLAPLLEGYLNATATPRHRGRTRWLWEVRTTDDAGRLCAISAVNVAVRPRRSP
jgi:uncharacterized protein (TIGR00369 family)